MYPFAFPVVAIESDGFALTYRTAEHFEEVPEDSVKGGRVPQTSLFTGSCHVWKPVRVVGVAPTGKRLLGRNVMRASFEFENVRAFELVELKATLRAAVENDPDDLWEDHEHLLRAIDDSTSFLALVDVLSPIE